LIYLVDGSNVLGRAGADREGVEDKRALLRAAAAFARRRKARLTLFFDGRQPESFASSLGAVRAVFSNGRPADDLIVDCAQKDGSREPVRVVTSDSALAARVQGRRVEVIRCGEFLSALREEAGDGVPPEDWEHYFSDPKNREQF